MTVELTAGIALQPLSGGLLPEVVGLRLAEDDAAVVAGAQNQAQDSLPWWAGREVRASRARYAPLQEGCGVRGARPAVEVGEGATAGAINDAQAPTRPAQLLALQVVTLQLRGIDPHHRTGAAPRATDGESGGPHLDAA